MSHIPEADLQQSLAVMRLRPETGEDADGMIAEMLEAPFETAGRGIAPRATSLRSAKE